ncbi:hypothetical protein RAA17_11075 [Komagataeibacter rhaeticus]|nr:hypothetical protein [Komagataeibacter rhaeticus]
MVPVDAYAQHGPGGGGPGGGGHGVVPALVGRVVAMVVRVLVDRVAAARVAVAAGIAAVVAGGGWDRGPGWYGPPPYPYDYPVYGYPGYYGYPYGGMSGDGAGVAGKRPAGRMKGRRAFEYCRVASSSPAPSPARDAAANHSSAPVTPWLATAPASAPSGAAIRSRYATGRRPGGGGQPVATAMQQGMAQKGGKTGGKGDRKGHAALSRRCDRT